MGPTQSEDYFYSLILIPRPDHELRPIIRSLICHLDIHAHYSSVFESYYLRITSEFYAAESAEKAQTLNAQEFLKHCALRGSEEDARSRHVLPESSWGAVKKATERSLLGGRLTWLAKEGIGLFTSCSCCSWFIKLSAQLSEC